MLMNQEIYSSILACYATPIDGNKDSKPAFSGMIQTKIDKSPEAVVLSAVAAVVPINAAQPLATINQVALIAALIQVFGNSDP